MLEQRFSDNNESKRDIPSFIEPRPPLIQNPFMRPRPQKGINLLEQFREDSELDEPELVQVYLRLKPCNVPNTLYEIRSDKCLVTSLDTATAGHGRRTQHNVSKMYTFSKIFGTGSNQKEIFEVVVKDNLKKLSEGHNFTLLTYGASGSGKTYTLMGTVGSPGLVPRSLEYVFRLVDAAQQPVFKPAEGGADQLNMAEQDYELQWVKRLRHVSAPLREKYRRMSTQLHGDLTTSSIDLSTRIRHYVWVSFVEIYNEAIYDLLAPPDKRTKLHIRENSEGNVYVKGATQAFVRSGEEAYDVMVAGKHNLVVAATGVHAHSSRSHCIFTITMLTETGAGSVRPACVRLCDLAGSERARATRNTGARMAESRAINSSLHVLERCLHMLRRNQRTAGTDALVPYRESKLTRLLGSGLSGARGEAVSMVVTLNPAPQYSHETKHVLSLAAVAQDIQINHTMLASNLECSSVDNTTVSCSDEVLKLRSDNERLHFELVQAQVRNKELMASMEERQQKSAAMMQELVEEAKDLTRQYYEAQLEALKAKMNENTDEYDKPSAQRTNSAGTPSRYLQSKVAKLMEEIAILEEELASERRARARAEKEVQHLRTCIEERDEKTFKDITPTHVEVTSLSDSEHESDDETNDPLNESLEPIFKKELNKSIAIQDKHDTVSIHTVDNIDEEDSETDTFEDDGLDATMSKNEASEVVENIDETYNNMTIDNKIDESINNTRDVFKDSEIFDNKHMESLLKSKCDINTDIPKSLSEDNEVQFLNESFGTEKFVPRGTYFVKTNETVDIDEIKSKKINLLRGTYCVNDEAVNLISTEPIKEKVVALKEVITKEDSILDKAEIKSTAETIKENELILKFKAPVTKEKSILDIGVPKKPSETLVSKIINSIKTSYGSNSSLQQFEQLEIAAKQCEETDANQTVFGDIKILKEKRNYFDKDDKQVSDESFKGQCPINNKEKRTFFNNIHVNEGNTIRINETTQNFDDKRSPSIVKDVVTGNSESSTIKKLLGESLPKTDVISSTHKGKLVKKHESVDIFEGFDSPLIPKAKEVTNKIPIKTNELVPDNIEMARLSIEQLVLNQSAKKAVLSVSPIRERNEPLVNKKQGKEEEIVKSVATTITTAKIKQETEADITVPIKIEKASEPDNTIDEFENIYKDITAPRATEFELLVSDVEEGNVRHKNTTNKQTNDETKVNFNDKNDDTHNLIKYACKEGFKDTNFDNDQSSKEKQDKDDIKYNLRKKQPTFDNNTTETSNDEEILVESQAKFESKVRKRPLRLRRRKNQDENDDKLKDIANLQTEFSDVTLDVPVTVKKAVKDIPSTDKGEENLPPLVGIQSCPSKSVTRSRRKLFTPRAEPLEESLSHTADSNERIYVPRPSYHRPRARRKL